MDHSQKILNQISSEPPYCQRCKSHIGNINCTECYPISFLCRLCDNYLHDFPTKKYHSRTPLYPTNSNYYSQTNPSIESNYPYSHSKNKSYSYDTPIQQYPTQTPNNEDKKIYEIEKEELLRKYYMLQKSISNTTALFNRKLQELENEKMELKTKHLIEMNNLTGVHEENIKRIITKTDNRINDLNSENLKLKKEKEELLKMLKKNENVIKQNSIIRDDKTENLESIIQSLNEDLSNLKENYENKINYYTQYFSTEKNKIIISYEETIEKLTMSLKEEREKYQEEIQAKDEKIKNLELILAKHQSDIVCGTFNFSQEKN